MNRLTAPETWERRKLHDLATWTNGMAFRDIEFAPTGRPVIKIAELKDGITGQTRFTEEEYGEDWLVKRGDMLFSWSGNPDTSIDVFWWSGDEGWLNQHIFKVQPQPGVDPRFFFYLLKYLKPTFAEIARNKQTTGLGHVTRGDLKELDVALPSRGEMRTIGRILGTLDDQIAVLQNMNQALEAASMAVFTSWFVDFEPVRGKTSGSNLIGMDSPTRALFPNELVETGLGVAPRGWRISCIGDEVKVVGGGTPSIKNLSFWDGGTHHWATPKDLSSIASPVLLGTERRITDAGLGQISSGLLPPGTVLLSSRAPIGYLAVAEIPVAINQGFIALVCDASLPNLYVLNWCRRNMDIISSRANGTTFLEISKGNFRPIPVLVPPPHVLEAFMKVAEPIHRTVVRNLQESNALAQVRDAILPRLLSGILRVNVDGNEEGDR